MTDKIERETLLPCPFCGNDKNTEIANERHDHSGGYFIDCPECHASTGLRFALGDDPRPLIIEQWNRRAALAQQAEPQEPVASYWLIECKNGFTGWYTSHRLDCRFFDTDPHKAYKFASKELAENKISERGHSCMIVTEHVDIAAQPAEPPTDAWRMAVDAAMDGHALDCTTPDSDPATCGALLVKQVEDTWRDIAAQPAPAAVPLTDDKIDHTLWRP